MTVPVWLIRLLKATKRFVESINPVAIYRAERERDREVLIAIVREVTTVLQQQSLVQLEQTKLMNQFLGQFQTDGSPGRSWTVTEDQDLERVAQALGMTKEEYLSKL